MNSLASFSLIVLPSLRARAWLDSQRMPLRSRILAVPAYRQKYLHYLRALAAVSLHCERLAPVIARYRALLA